MGRGTHRGFITYEELNKSLGKRNLSDENLSQAFIHILDEGIALVEKKSDFKILRKKEGSSKEEGKTMEKSDDTIRMYLREMGGVELLSREGEIAIAKRIEAGKDVMLIALSQSPMTAQQFYEWNDQLQKDEILVREIIDIDTNYMEDETTGPSAKQKNAGEIDKDEVELAEADVKEDGDIQFRVVGNTATPKLGSQNTSELTKSLFTDLRKGTGATVISSAGGMEFAMEGDDWSNGLFTYCFINGIKSKAADYDNNGEIWLSELKRYVSEQVSELSGGRQQPTSRIENQSVDFRVW